MGRRCFTAGFAQSIPYRHIEAKNLLIVDQIDRCAIEAWHDLDTILDVICFL